MAKQLSHFLGLLFTGIGRYDFPFGLNRKRKMVMRFLFLVLSLVTSISLGAIARENSKYVNGSSFTVGDKMKGFFETAFSQKMWNEDVWYHNGDGFSKILTDTYESSNWGLNNRKQKQEFESANKYHPWWAEHVYMTEGLPRRGVINKWDGRISVGLGWPKYNPTHPESPGSSKEHLSKNADIYSLAESTIEDVVGYIKSRTKINIEFFMPSDPREFTEEYAGIRVIPTETIWQRTPGFKGGSAWLPERYETMLWEGTLFESSNIATMDGYFLAGADNKIDLAVCKVSSKLTPELFKALVGECIIRSLGLPGISTDYSSSLLGEWSQPLIEDDNANFVFGQPTDFESLMLSILYCPSVKPGMDQNAVLDLMMRKDSCTSKILTNR